MNRIKKELAETTDRWTYNRLRKMQLERTGKIRCAWCAYHRGENDTNKWYGEIHRWRHEEHQSRVRRPNWKLTSKSAKQWMPRGDRREGVPFRPWIRRGREYFKIVF